MADFVQAEAEADGGPRGDLVALAIAELEESRRLRNAAQDARLAWAERRRFLRMARDPRAWPPRRGRRAHLNWDRAGQQWRGVRLLMAAHRLMAEVEAQGLRLVRSGQ